MFILFGCIMTGLPLLLASFLHLPGEVKSIVEDIVEPLNNGYIWTSHNYLSFIKRLSSLQRLKI